MNRLRYALMVPSAVMSIALPFTLKEEGMRTKAYLDSVGVPTICAGHTDGVQLGDTKTETECKFLFFVTLGFYAFMIDQYVETDMKPQFHAALSSWAYNVGLGAAKKSTLLKKANSGDYIGACNELPKWKNAGGKPILLNRRLREQKLCMEGA